MSDVSIVTDVSIENCSQQKRIHVRRFQSLQKSESLQSFRVRMGERSAVTFKKKKKIKNVFVWNFEVYLSTAPHGRRLESTALSVHAVTDKSCWPHPLVMCGAHIKNNWSVNLLYNGCGVVQLLFTYILVEKFDALISDWI